MEISLEKRHWVIEGLCARFGFAKEVFEPFSFVQSNPRRLHLVPKNHVFPQKVRIETCGMDFLNMRSIVPKLSTSAAGVFGPYAKNHVVKLSKEEIVRYCLRQPVLIADERKESVQSQGYVIVRFESLFPGLGFAKEVSREGFMLLSKYPKGRACHLKL